MIRTAKMLAFGSLIVVVAGLLVSAAWAQAVNKPSNPQAQDRLLAISSTWDSNDAATYDNATRSFESVRSEYPGTLEAELAYVELLRIRWVKGEQEAVLAEYQRWLATAPSPVAQGHILCYFANYAAKVGDAKRAEELCKSAISLAGDHIVAGLAAIELAKMYVRTPGREAEALALYEQTTRKFTGTRIEWICRREWARGLNAYSPSASSEAVDKARQLLSPAAQAQPESFQLAHARYNLAEVLLALNRPEEALAACELGAAQVESHRDEEWARHCLRLLIDIQRSLQQWDAAIASAHRYIKLFPDKDAASAQFMLGACYMGKGDFGQAAQELAEVVNRYPGSRGDCAIALYRKAECERMLGRSSDVRATLEQLVRDYPESPVAADVKLQLGGP